MKKLSVLVCVQLWLIVSCFSISAQDFQKIRNGIEHAKITKQMKSADGKDENVVIPMALHFSDALQSEKSNRV